MKPVSIALIVVSTTFAALAYAQQGPTATPQGADAPAAPSAPAARCGDAQAGAACPHGGPGQGHGDAHGHGHDHGHGHGGHHSYHHGDQSAQPHGNKSALHHDGHHHHGHHAHHAGGKRERVAARWMRRVDTDRDGQVSFDELRAQQQRQMKMFERADANGDGKVSREEFRAMRQAMREEHRKQREAAKTGMLPDPYGPDSEVYSRG